MFAITDTIEVATQANGSIKKCDEINAAHKMNLRVCDRGGVRFI